MRRGHGVRLDGGLQAVDPEPLLHPANRMRQLVDIRHVADALVVEHPPLEIAVELVEGSLADADHGRAGRGQAAHEFALVGRECRLDEYDVHYLRS